MDSAPVEPASQRVVFPVDAVQVARVIEHERPCACNLRHLVFLWKLWCVYYAPRKCWSNTCKPGAP